jgi:acetyl-CoA acetyltransferase family protein
VTAAHVAAAVRTPIGKRGRSLAAVHPAELLGTVIAAALNRAKVPAAEVDQVLAGCVTQVGDQAYNVGRIAWLTAGLPDTVPAQTIDAQCGSSQQAVNLGAALIESGAAEIVVACGVEVMSRHALGSNVEGGLGEPMGRAYRERYEVTTQGEAAERIADRWHISREECDEIGLRSQELAAAAWEAGRFADEILAVDLAAAEGEIRVNLERDECPRPTTLASLRALAPVFRPNGALSAGSSSQISDGAACLVLISHAAAERLKIRTLAQIAGQAFVGVDPVIKLTGPIPATRRLFQTCGLAVADVDLFECNEAFASVLGAWQREIGAPMDKVNVNGGAIALGHPVGASGARLCATAVHELRHRGGGQAVVTMCCGGGLGTATLFKSSGA